jgi:hypothetical protein
MSWTCVAGAYDGGCVEGCKPGVQRGQTLSLGAWPFAGDQVPGRDHRRSLVGASRNSASGDRAWRGVEVTHTPLRPASPGRPVCGKRRRARFRIVGHGAPCTPSRQFRTRSWETACRPNSERHRAPERCRSRAASALGPSPVTRRPRDVDRSDVGRVLPFRLLGCDSAAGAEGIPWS